MATQKRATSTRKPNASAKGPANQPPSEPFMPVAENAPAPTDLPDKIAEGGRSGFGSRLGFILAAVGSAVGFGSIARFPMNAANNGGAMFLLMYAFIMLAIGIPMMVAEFSLGRSAQKNTAGAFNVLTGEAKTRWRSAGILFFVLAAFILSYYGILTGWTLRYLFGSLSGAYFDDPDAYLTDTIEGPYTLLWFAVTMVLTGAALTTKISKGIEKVNLFMMPTLYLIIIGLAIYAATLPNIAAGYRYYLDPDFTAFTLPVFTAAIGQAFFSLSLAQGAMMTYSSYIPKTTSLASNAAIISGSTLTFATMCGFMIFPLLASFGYALNPDTPAGLGLIFGPLADTFAQMGTPTGQIVGTLFFTATFFAAFTSAVSLAEPGIAYVVEERGIDRRRAAILVCALIYVLGIGAAFSFQLLDFESLALTDASIVLGGFLIAVYVGWFSPGAVARARMDECEKGWTISKFAYPMMRYVMPAILGVLLLFQIMGTPCVLSGGDESSGLIEQIVKQFGGDAPKVLGCAPSAPAGATP
ncbi:MAG TPA: sodium-dependent transporter [Candidatus Thermoplasmatota archaeon]|nr:sodium-dependent transporter [Candidatus Thermoplasmatota archaeon]